MAQWSKVLAECIHHPCCLGGPPLSRLLYLVVRTTATLPRSRFSREGFGREARHRCRVQGFVGLREAGRTDGRCHPVQSSGLGRRGEQHLGCVCPIDYIS